ncbi:MAG TPA: bifunctional DNA primase/polymerase [Gaiellaceae bacterium]|nr:bifunctional DNA primase/polymerase [Gaiellaceae bacterium]
MRDRRRLALPPAANAAGAALSPLLAVAAVAYAEHGWHVLPLRARAKVPATPHGFKDATASSERVIEWWRLSANSNIGIATGPSGLLAIDLDGEEGRDAWADLAARNRGHAPTRIYETGTGGLHIWFSGDGPSIPAREGAGLPPLRWHDLRHLAASAMIASGMELRDVSYVLGHATTATTERTYKHQFDRQTQHGRIRDGLAAAFPEARS